jgi:uncharacterized SAM-binding protein YcdF (DUF218 family)
VQILIWNAGRHVEQAPRTDYLIVLGAGLRGEQLSLTLQYRMDTALRYLKQHPDIPVIVSGGLGRNELITEATAMKRYLLKKGISENRILTEDQATSTYENLKFSKKLIPANSTVTIVTSDFHMFRARMLAAHLGYDAYSFPSQSKKHLLIKHYTREHPAIVKSILFDILF